MNKHSKKRIAGTVLSTLAVTLGVLLSTSCYWALSQFADLNMEEIVYELSAPLEGTGNGMIEDYILRCAVPAVAALLVCILLAVFFGKKRWYRYLKPVLGLGGLAAIIAPAVVFWNSTNIGEYLANRNVSSDFIEVNYVNPKDVELTFPEEKRNLIFIYMESMETSFSDYDNGGLSDTDYIPELTKLAQENEDFSGSSTALNGGFSMPGTTWTIGGMFASTAGLPLMGSVDDNDMSEQDSFFPNLVTLGDILEQQGYSQTFLCGSDVTFGGRELYLTEHGNFDFIDWVSAREEGLLPSDYHVFWGYEDQKLFSLAKDRITELSQQDEPFNVTMLTVDTHMPDGFRCGLCEDDFGDFSYGNALACSSRQVTEFVEWAQEQSWYDNTSIVLVGDHPTMATSMASLLDSDGVRKTYACYVNSAVTPENPDAERTYTTFDTFPTTLASLGVTIPGNRLGLGTNLFSDTQTVSEKYGYDEERAELTKQSDTLNTLEAPDRETQELISRYEGVEPDITTDPTDSHIVVISPDVSADSDQISGIRLKIWYYEGEQYVHLWLDAVKRSDGTYVIDYRNPQFFDTEELHLQLLAVTENGSVNLGEEMVIDPNNYDPKGLRNPVRQYADSDANEETLPDTIKENYMTEQEITLPSDGSKKENETNAN